MPKIKLKNLDRSGAADLDVATYKNVSGSWVPAASAGGGGGSSLPTTPKQTITYISGAGATAVIVPSPAPGFLRFIGPMHPYYPVSPLLTGIKIRNALTGVLYIPMEALVEISGTLLTASLPLDNMTFIDHYHAWGNSDAFGPQMGGPTGWYIPTFLSSSEALTLTVVSKSFDPASYEAVVQAMYIDIPEDNIYINRLFLTTSYADVIPEPPAGFVHVAFPPMFIRAGTADREAVVSPTQFTNLTTAPGFVPDIVTRHSNSSGVSLEVYSGSLDWNQSDSLPVNFITKFFQNKDTTGTSSSESAWPLLVEVGQSWQARFKNVEEGGFQDVSASCTTVYWRLPV